MASPCVNHHLGEGLEKMCRGSEGGGWRQFVQRQYTWHRHAAQRTLFSPVVSVIVTVRLSVSLIREHTAASGGAHSGPIHAHASTIGHALLIDITPCPRIALRRAPGCEMTRTALPCTYNQSAIVEQSVTAMLQSGLALLNGWRLIANLSQLCAIVHQQTLSGN